MEQHKVLLIIVGVAVVLAAVVGVGLWLFYPRDGAGTDLAQDGRGGEGGFEWQPLDYLQGQGEVPGLEDEVAEPVEEPDEFEVTYGVLPDTQTQGTAESQTPRTRITTAPSGEADATAEEPVMVAVPSAAQVAAATPRSETRSTASSGTTGTASTSAAPSRTATSAPSATTSSAAPTSEDDFADRAYWVQAISSPNLDTVEQARITLKEHQLGSRILTRVINGRTYYRLRIGPFAVRAEAEKFLGWVQEIRGFADAMIFVDYNTPVLAARPQ